MRRACACACACLSECACACVCVPAHVCVLCTCMCVHAYVCLCTCACVCLCICMPVCVRVRVCMCMYVCLNWPVRVRHQPSGPVPLLLPAVLVALSASCLCFSYPPHPPARDRRSHRVLGARFLPFPGCDPCVPSGAGVELGSKEQEGED